MARGSISTECAESATVKVEMIKVEEERGRLLAVHGLGLIRSVRPGNFQKPELTAWLINHMT